MWNLVHQTGHSPDMKYLLKTVQYDQYFAFKYLKQTFEKKSHKIGFIKYGPGMKYLLKTIQYDQYFTFKFLKWTSEKK